MITVNLCIVGMKINMSVITNDKMWKKLYEWFLFTVGLTLLPLGIKLVTAYFNNIAVPTFDISKEYLFLCLIVLIDAWRNIINVDKKNGIKVARQRSITILICSLFSMVTFLIYNNVISYDLGISTTFAEEKWNNVVWIWLIACLVISLTSQIMEANYGFK